MRSGRERDAPARSADSGSVATQRRKLLGLRGVGVGFFGRGLGLLGVGLVRGSLDLSVLGLGVLDLGVLDLVGDRSRLLGLGLLDRAAGGRGGLVGRLLRDRAGLDQLDAGHRGVVAATRA